MSIQKTSIRYAVPYSTLYDRKVLERQSYQKAHSEEQKLTPYQEARLVTYCKQLEDAGMPAQRDLLQYHA